MPPRDPTKVQLDFPQLNADLISQLNLVGQIGLLDFATFVQPTFIVGSRNLVVNAEPPVFTSSQIFQGFNIAPVVNTVIADTGALPAGDYDIFARSHIWNNLSATGHVALEHRNAANAATLAILLDLAGGTAAGIADAVLDPMAYRIAQNERLRIIVLISGQSAAGATTGVIGARIRLTP